MTSIKILQWVAWTLRHQLTRTNRTAKELKFGAMEAIIMEILKRVSKKVMESIFGQMGANIQGNG